MTIGSDDCKRTYITIAAAREMSGLRIVLGEFSIPGPWHESCKGIFHVKGLEYTRVRSANEGAPDAAAGMGGTQSELVAWTGQSSAPVVIWNDELPRSHWMGQLTLAERLAPNPPLIPEDSEDRIRMFGLATELLGENGLVWSKRLIMVDEPLKTLPANDEQRSFWAHLGEKYLYTSERAALASERIQEVVSTMANQLKAQQTRGSKYLLGDRLSALDIYWAACCGILAPMPEERCPMATDFRGVYGNTHVGIAAALVPELLQHRDYIYETYLELPIVF